MPATPLTVEVLAALRRIGCRVTTTDLMRLLNHDRPTPLVVEQVYRAVDALRARGAVRRLEAPKQHAGPILGSRRRPWRKSLRRRPARHIMTATGGTTKEALRTRDWLPALVSGRPHQVIGDDPAEPYLLRWFLIPRNPIINIYRHRFCQSDPTVPHDHPWHFASIVLRGSYREISEHRSRVRRPGSVAFRRASTRHRVELLGHPVTTVIITGPRCRRWGFWCPRPAAPATFVPWQQFGSGGCGEYLSPPTSQAKNRTR